MVDAREAAIQDKVDQLAGKSLSLENLLSLRAECLRNRAIEADSSTGNICFQVVKPLTRERRSSYVEYLEHVSQLDSQPAQYHVVHSWRTKFNDLCAGIADGVNAQEGGPSPENTEDLLDIEWHHRNAPRNLVVTLFICTFVVNQHALNDVGQEVAHPCNPDCEIDKFDLVASAIHRRFRKPVLAILDLNRHIFSRLCCLEELHRAIVDEIPIRYCGYGVHDAIEINALKAECASNLQRLLIQSKILYGIGFQSFDQCLMQHLTQFARRRLGFLDRALHGAVEGQGERRAHGAGTGEIAARVPGELAADEQARVRGKCELCDFFGSRQPDGRTLCSMHVGPALSAREWFQRVSDGSVRCGLMDDPASRHDRFFYQRVQEMGPNTTEIGVSFVGAALFFTPMSGERSVPFFVSVRRPLTTRKVIEAIGTFLETSWAGWTNHHTRRFMFQAGGFNAARHIPESDSIVENAIATFGPSAIHVSDRRCHIVSAVFLWGQRAGLEQIETDQNALLALVDMGHSMGSLRTIMERVCSSDSEFYAG